MNLSLAPYLRFSFRAAGSVACLTTLTAAQVTYSVDWHSPSVSRLDSAGLNPITEGDVLLPFTGQPIYNAFGAPQIALNGDQLGINLHQFCVGHAAGDPCGVEVDGLSFGSDPLYELDLLFIGPMPEPVPKQWISVDEFASAVARTTTPPNIKSEAPVGDSSADVMVEITLPTLPPLDVPTPGGSGHVGALDGNGLPSGTGFYYRGLGLREPNLHPIGSPPPDPGDNLDSLNIGPIAGPGMPVYYSLDAAFVDPIDGNVNSGSAAAAGVPPGAILQKIVGTPGAAVVFATPAQLGLDVFGAGTDDLDALELAENGTGVYEPSAVPYDWQGTLQMTDMVLFSVRRGSAVIGSPDSLFGRAIEAGDILVPPVAGGNGFPGIFIAAENFSLATVRTNGVAFGDDLNAMALARNPCFDCNSNGIEDAVDIANGTSADANMNGIPDECERSFARYCLCPSSVDQCSNPDASAGCANSSGSGAALAALAGSSSSVSADDLVLTTTSLPIFTIGIYFTGQTPQQVPFGDGLLCVSPPTYRLGAVGTGGGGVANRGPGLVSYVCGSTPTCILIGQTWRFQFWYRNVVGPCGLGFNTSNALAVLFTP